MTQNSQESTVSDYFSLLKPRVMSLVVFTGLCGVLLAPGEINGFILAFSVFCIALGSGAAGAINMWYERELDAKMKRTKARPLVRGVIAPDDAIVYAVILSVISVFMLGVFVNWLAGGLLVAAILFYVFIYTIWLKPRTAQNIVIGGAAGAFPPMIGWAAVTGEITLYPLILFAIIFFWTPAHFWALALSHNDDYKRAKIPMLPVVSGEKITKILIFVYSLILTGVSIAPYFMGFAGEVYLYFAGVLNLYYIYLNYMIFLKNDRETQMRSFRFSILYLFAIFAILVVEKYAIGLT